MCFPNSDRKGSLFTSAKERIWSVVVLLFAAGAVALSTAGGADGEEGTLRRPAVPLVVHDPYFSVWSRFDRLTDGETTHWTGEAQPLHGLARIDGEVFRVMGSEPAGVKAMEQKAVEVLPTRTLYRFEDAKIRLTLTFLSPVLPDDLDVFARPVTYIVWEAEALDGKSHKVEVYLDVSALMAVNAPSQEVRCERFDAANLRVARVGTTEQPVLKRQGDRVRIDWGYAYLAVAGRRAGRLSLQIPVLPGSTPMLFCACLPDNRAA